jgi:hypothetical protein
MKAMDIYLAALVSPRRLMAGLADKKPGGILTPSFFAFAGGLVSALLAVLVISGVQGESGRALFSTLGVFVPLAALFLLTFKLALVHLFASLWGLQGDVRLFWVGHSLSYMPFFLLLPLALILRALDLSGLFALACILAYAMALRIEIMAMSAVYALNTGRAFLFSILPLALAFVFTLLVLLAFVVLLGGLIIAALGFVL